MGSPVAAAIVDPPVEVGSPTAVADVGPPVAVAVMDPPVAVANVDPPVAVAVVDALPNKVQPWDLVCFLFASSA